MVWLDFVGSVGSMLDYYDAAGDSARREGILTSNNIKYGRGATSSN